MKISKTRWWFAGAAIILFTFLATGVLANFGYIKVIDQTVIDEVQRPVDAVLQQIIIIMTTSGNEIPTGILTVVLVIGLLLWRRYRDAAFLLVNVVVWAGGFNWLLKQLVQRHRPVNDRLIHITSYSFPSGHAITVMLLFGALIILTNELVSNEILKTSLMTVFTLWIIGIGLSRIFVGVHYPTDVLAGWSLGFFLLTITQYVFYQLPNRKRLRY